MRVLGIVGSYRKGGMIDQAVDKVLDGAHAAGASTEKRYLIDCDLQYCDNCRRCMQQPGAERGACVVDDDMKGLLDAIDYSDGLVLGSPTNFGTVTAVTKVFIERLACYAYWPWGAPAPKPRHTRRAKRAVLIVSSAAPSILERLFMGAMPLLRQVARVLGARVTGALHIGFAAKNAQPLLPPSAARRAHRLGERLVRAVSRG